MDSVLHAFKEHMQMLNRQELARVDSLRESSRNLSAEERETKDLADKLIHSVSLLRNSVDCRRWISMTTVH